MQQRQEARGTAAATANNTSHLRHKHVIEMTALLLANIAVVLQLLAFKPTP